MSRVDVAQHDVYDWIVSFLRLELDLGERSCYLTLDPDSPPIIPPSGDYFVTISPASGEFTQGEQIPGNISERSDVTVTVYTRIRLDSTDHDRQALLDASRGLIGSQMRVLAALVGKEIEGDDGETYLRVLAHTTHSTMPRFDKARGIGSMGVDVGIEFDWDLSTSEEELSTSSDSPSSVSSSSVIDYAAEVDDLLVESPTGDFLDIFDVFSPTDNTSEYNASCWAASLDFTGLSYTGLSATAISPRHAVSCSHSGGPGAVGSERVWIAADGTRHVRTMLAKTEVSSAGPLYHDMTIAYYDSDLPDSIAIHKVLPADFLDYLPMLPQDGVDVENPEGGIAVRMPALVPDQHRRVQIHEIFNVTAEGEPFATAYFRHSNSLYLEGYPGASTKFTMSGNREAYNGDHELHSGDSGKPVFLLLDGELVLLGTHGGTTAVGSYAHYLSEANAVMAALEANNGGSDGYQLQQWEP
ncbi:MAG: hypothetical protein GY832_22515 [Chloroflexi bacterium]|nr:hypothetical protein [Chloroflexota bacterium]